jgi:thiol-disulfide isomerase/thioredoxin
MFSTHSPSLRITAANALFGVMALLLTAPGCQKPDSSSTQNAHLSGRVLNPMGDQVRIRLGDTVLNTELDAEGKFAIDLPLNEADYATLRIGPEYTNAFFQPGDSLELRLDATQFDLSLTWLGKGAEINNYLAGKVMRTQQFAAGGNPYLLQEDSFVQRAGEQHKVLLRDLERAGLEAGFAERERLELDWEWASQLASYPDAHPYFSGAENYSPSAGYWDFIAQLNLDHPHNARSETFQQFISAWFSADRDPQSAEEQDATQLALAQMDRIARHIQQPEVLASLYGSLLREYLSYRGADGALPLYERYNSEAGTGPERKQTEKRYRDWQALSQGKKAPDFSGSNLQGQRMELSDLKGKTVYVDVWATWCGPCLRELPALEALQQEFEGQEDVVLLSISVDEDSLAWANMLREKQLGGMQWFAGQAWESEVVKNYLIEGIPRFLLIAPDGTIRSAHAPRPSSGEVADRIRELSAAGV